MYLFESYLSRVFFNLFYFSSVAHILQKIFEKKWEKSTFFIEHTKNWYEVCVSCYEKKVFKNLT